MKALILAAGSGKRLGSLTKASPKCLIDYRGQAILDRAISSLTTAGITNIGIVTGYCASCIDRPNLTKFYNSKFASTNMVESLFSAETFLDGEDVIVVYGDIVFEPSVVCTLIKSKDPFPVVVDLLWLELWNKRMEDPLLDAETLQLDTDKKILNLGKRASSISEIDGQYIGMFLLRGEYQEKISRFYRSLDRHATYDGQEFKQMYMTTFIQLIIDNIMPVHAACIKGGWTEIDTPSDLMVDMVNSEH